MRVLMVSDNFIDLTCGIPASQLYGKRTDEIFPSDFARKIVEDDFRIMKEGQASSYEEEFNGRFYTTFKYPIKIKNRPSYLAGFTIDITTRKLAEKALIDSQARLAEARKLARFGDWFWDIKTGDVVWSDEVYEIFGLDKKKFKPHINSIMELSPWPEDHTRNMELIRRTTESHEEGVYDQRFLRLDGTIGYYHSNFRGNYNTDGKLISIVGVVQDISERKLAEETLKELNLHLEMASKAKSDFVANISHEIRTPLNSILGFTDYLIENSVDVESKDYLHRINKSGKALLGLMNNILELSKIESGVSNLELQPLHLLSLVQDTIDMFQERAERKNIKLMLDISSNLKKAFMLTDSSKFQRVLINLIGNAIKFTEYGEVKIIILKNESSDLKIEIKDTGIGIPKEKKHLLFQRFTQVDSSPSKKFEGSGLGLCISKEIIDLMGGSISCESVEHVGTSFIITIPFIETSEKTVVSQNTVLNSSFLDKNLSILLVDDSEENRLLIQLFLKNISCVVDCAENGIEAIEKIKIKTYDIVFMDMQMPEMDGFEATKNIRNWERDQKRISVPIIALTGFAFKEEKEKCLLAGCNIHLAKPINKRELLQVISIVLSGSKKAK